MVEVAATVLFAAALVHTFTCKLFEGLARRHPRHAGLLHLLGEVEVVFGFWAAVLVVTMAALSSGQAAVAYVESRQYTEPLFVFAVMVVAASRPVLEAVKALVGLLARFAPVRHATAEVWLALALVPLSGSLITEPAAMTLAALVLAPRVFCPSMPEWLKYGALGVLFVNVSIGGTFTSYAAPPVLMVASAWDWDTAFMARTFGWKAGLAVAVNATAITWVIAGRLGRQPEPAAPAAPPIPWLVSTIHLAFLGAIVALAHYPAMFLGLFLFFLGFAHAYGRHQSPLILKEGLLVGFFLAGLVVLGGMQQWWLQPIIGQLQPAGLFVGALALTAIADNAALTYLGSLVEGLSAQGRYMLMAGAVAGGGLTIIANAPNPAGVALLRGGFADGSIGVGGLLLGALAPTAVAVAAFLVL